MTLEEQAGPMNAARAVVLALEAAADSAPNFDIQRFWMKLYDCGYEVVNRRLLDATLAEHNDGRDGEKERT